jgi:hypothetical protein
MGSGSWSKDSFVTYSSVRGYDNLRLDGMDVAKFFTANDMPTELDPKKAKLRESRDSVEHPNSTPIILALDVTGSMGSLASQIAKHQLNELMMGIYEKKPVSDPQVMFVMIGDHKTDKAPIQVSQFESDIRIAEQLTSAWFEGHGGGNGGESYHAAWYFAARHTDIDSLVKRGRKGFLFTIGDECCHNDFNAKSVKSLFGDSVSEDLTASGLLKEVSEKYEVFHLLVGNYSQHGSEKYWKSLMGDHAIILPKTEKLPSVILDTIKMTTSTPVSNPYELED